MLSFSLLLFLFVQGFAQLLPIYPVPTFLRQVYPSDHFFRHYCANNGKPATVQKGYREAQACDIGQVQSNPNALMFGRIGGVLAAYSRLGTAQEIQDRYGLESWEWGNLLWEPIKDQLIIVDSNNIARRTPLMEEDLAPLLTTPSPNQGLPTNETLVYYIVRLTDGPQTTKTMRPGTTFLGLAVILQKDVIRWAVFASSESADAIAAFDAEGGNDIQPLNHLGIVALTLALASFLVSFFSVYLSLKNRNYSQIN